MPADTYAIETSRLMRRFGQLTAVDNVNLRVPTGSIYSFLGLNGAGKTTTIRLLLGLIYPDEGQIKLFGASFDRQKRDLFNNVGALVESPSLYLHLTGYENMELTRLLIDGKRSQIDRALAIVGLTQDARRVVRGYSLGMKQRLALALALLNEPKLLILDEPTNGLDPAGIHEMRALIMRLSTEQGITIFLSSHLLSEIQQVATHIGIIHHGKLIFQNTPEDLRTRVRDFVRVEVNRTNEALRLLIECGWKAQSDGDGLLTVVTNQREDVATMNAQLNNNGFKVFHISIEQPSLEDIFLQFTRNQI